LPKSNEDSVVFELQIYAIFINGTNLFFSVKVKYLVESLRFAIFAAIYPRGLFFY